MLASQRVPELSPGITVFFGANEAGKSTCLNFFRAMLFGYARNRRSIDYLTEAKGLSGGSLLLDSESFGQVRLARQPGPHGGKVALSGPDGSPRPVSDLAVLLRGCTPELFDKVFAFSLGELMHFSSLTDDSIRHALHGAAFGTGLTSPGQVLKQLDEAMRGIFAPRATSSKIHGLLRELEEVNATIRERGNEVDRYAVLRAELDGVTGEQAVLLDRFAGMEKERQILERLMGLRRRWESFREAEDALAAFPEGTGTFTPDGRERLDRLAERLEDRRHALAQARYALERAESERAALIFDPALAAAADAVRSLAERKERVRSSVGELRALEAEKASATREAAAIRADLGPDWDAAKLQAADISLAAHERCETLGGVLAGAERAETAARAETDRLEREAGTARTALEEALAALREAGGDLADGAAVPDDGALERLSRLLTRAEDAHGKTGALALAIRNAEQALDAAVAAVDPSWSRQDCENAALSPAERERLLERARSVVEAGSKVGECERDAAAAGLVRDEAAERVAMLERSVAEQAARLAAGTGEPATEGGEAGSDASTEVPLALATSFLERSRRVLRRAQTARKSLEAARAEYDAANEQLGDIASLARGARTGSAFPWATLVLFFAALFLVCGGGALFLGLRGGEQAMVLAGTGALAGGAALSLAWLVLAARGGKDPADERMERTWAAIEQRLVRKRLAAQDAKLEAEAVLESLPTDAPDLFPSGAIDADALAEAEQRLARCRDAVIVLERDARELEREKTALGSAGKRFTLADSALREALLAQDRALAAWREALAASRLPAAVPAGEARSFLDSLAAASSCRAVLQARLAEQRAAENCLAECRRFALSLPELADMLASLPEPGSPLAPDPGPWLALAREFLAGQRTAGRERLRLRELAAMRASRLAELEDLLSRAKEALRAASDNKRDALGAWRSWLRDNHLSESLSPETARRALEAAAKARAAQETALRIEARISTVREEAAAFLRDLAPLAEYLPEASGSGRIRSMATAREISPEGIAAALSLLDELTRAAREAGENAAIARAGERELPALRDAVALAEEQAEATRLEMEGILRLARCDTPESYRGAHAAWERREAALAARRVAAVAFEREAAEAGFSPDEATALFRSTAAEDTERDLAGNADARAATAEAQRALSERKGRLEKAMEGLLSEKGLTDLLARRESLLSEVRAAAGEWSRYAVAREMLLEAKGRFESERRGGVIHYAGEIFSAITEGAYTGITLSLADESVAAVARDGSLKNPESELSRGTREQLYLALRLAYILDHGAQAEKLPVVMDDILVNFDDERARRTASALDSFAREHQILFFTCHEKTARLLAETGPDTAGYRLDRGAFTRM